MLNHMLWNAQTKAIIDIFQTQFFVFFHFRTQSRRVVVVREVVDREVADREVVDR